MVVALLYGSPESGRRRALWALSLTVYYIV